MAFGTVEGCLKVWENNIDNIGGLLAETSTPGGISVRQLYNLEQNAFKATVKECYEEGYLRTKAYSDGILEMLNRHAEITESGPARFATEAKRAGPLCRYAQRNSRSVNRHPPRNPRFLRTR